MRGIAMIAVTMLAPSIQVAAQSPMPPKEEQIAAAILPLPDQLRAGARVLGYGPDGKFGLLREGKGMICLAQYPKEERFHVSCYHESLEPFMARGRDLRASGTPETQVDTVRFAEITSGKLKMPNGPATLYQLIGGTYDAKAGTVDGARRLYVVYIPFATGASTGLPERPRGSDPWIMFPGTPKAHIMFTASMQ
ncbi:MAG: hypothetical protein ACT4P7_11565 [Gemmatimonadaceae bacterium]